MEFLHDLAAVNAGRNPASERAARIAETITPQGRRDLAREQGGTDYYYGRRAVPSLWIGGKPYGVHVVRKNMNEAEIAAYTSGYRKAEQRGDCKDWG